MITDLVIVTVSLWLTISLMRCGGAQGKRVNRTTRRDVSGLEGLERRSAVDHGERQPSRSMAGQAGPRTRHMSYPEHDRAVVPVHPVPVSLVEPNTAGDNSDQSDGSSAVMTALLLDYQMARDDDRAAQNVLSVMMGVAFALLGALIAALSNYPLSREAFAIAPLLPLAAISYVVLIGSSVTMRSFYMRALEEELRKRLFANTDLAILHGVKPMSGTEFIVSVSSGVRGRPALRLAYAVIMGTVLIVFGGVAILIGYRVGGGYAIIMFAVYAPLAVTLFIEGVTVGIAGRSAFQVAIRRFRDDEYTSVRRLGDLESFGTDKRSLRSYLLFPRPGDLVKWTFVPVSAVIGLLLPGVFDGFSTRDLGAVLVGWLAFEYLAYQARYQVNDVRGLAHDLHHPKKSSRSRLPVRRHGVRTSIEASFAAVATRLAILVIVIILNPFDVREELGIAAVAAFLVAIPYEYLRSREPADPAAALRLAGQVWVIVGAGYAIRVCLGLSLVGFSSPAVLVVFAVSAWFFGIMFVTLTWVLEATSYLLKAESASYYYLNDQAGGRSEEGAGEDESVRNKAGLTEKPHVLHLLPFICINAEPTGALDAGSDCSRIKFLESRPTLVNPWNLSLMGATSSVIVACSLASISPEFGMADSGMLVMTIIVAFMLSAVRSTASRWVVLAVGLLGILGLSVALSVEYRWPALLALLIFGGLYTFFGGSSYHDVVTFNEQAAQRISDAKRTAIRLVIGRSTFDSVFTEPRAGGGESTHQPGGRVDA